MLIKHLGCQTQCQTKQSVLVLSDVTFVAGNSFASWTVLAFPRIYSPNLFDVLPLWSRVIDNQKTEEKAKYDY